MMRALVVLMTVSTAAGPALGAEPAPGFKLGSFERDGKPFVGVVPARLARRSTSPRRIRALPTAARVDPPADLKDADRPLRRGAARAHPRDLRRSSEVRRAAPVRVRPRRGPDAPADRLPHHDAQRRGQLPRARAWRWPAPQAQRRPASRPRALAARHAAAEHHQHPGHLGARGLRRARWNPYMFIKLPSAVIAAGEPIRCRPAARRSTGSASSGS